MLSRWQPSPRMTISRLSMDDAWTSEEEDWKPAPSSTREPDQNGLLEARIEPIGNRTAVWAGELVRKDGVPTPVVIKACWLNPALAGHEYKILRRLQSPSSSQVFPHPTQRDPTYREDWIKEIPGWEEIGTRIPKPYGKVSFPPDIAHLQNPSVNAGVPASETTPAPVPVRLYVLVMEGEPAIDLSTIEDLTMRQLMRIYVDVVLIL